MMSEPHLNQIVKLNAGAKVNPKSEPDHYSSSARSNARPRRFCASAPEFFLAVH